MFKLFLFMALVAAAVCAPAPAPAPAPGYIAAAPLVAASYAAIPASVATATSNQYFTRNHNSFAYAAPLAYAGYAPAYSAYSTEYIY